MLDRKFAAVAILVLLAVATPAETKTCTQKDAEAADEMVDRWQTLPQLSSLFKRDPALKKFVLRHIDGTVDSGDLDKIRQLSASSCPQAMNVFCQDLQEAAVQAAR